MHKNHWTEISDDKTPRLYLEWKLATNEKNNV